MKTDGNRATDRTRRWRALLLLASLLGAFAALVLGALCFAGPAKAQNAATPGPYERARPPAPEEPGFRLSGDYTSDVNANVSGGERRGIAYLGKIALIADADLGRLLGMVGATAHASIIDIHGTGLSSHFVSNLSTVSGLEAEPAVRLNQLWVAIDLTKRTSLRIGKFPAAQDFMASSTASLFINATFGWPTSFATDLPSGGPSWPLAAPGIMIKSHVSSKVMVSGAIFAGDPAGPGDGDPQRRDAHGFNAFGFAGRPMLIGEVGLQIGSTATVKAGGWIHFGAFAAQGPGPLPQLSGDWTIYGVADWKILGGKKGGRTLNGFARWSVSPGDRNAISWYGDAGLVLSGPFQARPDDKLGLAVAHVGVTDRLWLPARPRAEWVVELTYQAQLTTSLSVQPNLQLIVDPIDPGALGAGSLVASKNALVLGARAAWTF